MGHACPEMLCEESTLRDRDQEEAEQGFGPLARGTCWDCGGRKSAARPFGKEAAWTVRKCHSVTEGLARPQDRQLLAPKTASFLRDTGWGFVVGSPVGGRGGGLISTSDTY